MGVDGRCVAEYGVDGRCRTLWCGVTIQRYSSATTTPQATDAGMSAFRDGCEHGGYGGRGRIRGASVGSVAVVASVACVASVAVVASVACVASVAVVTSVPRGLTGRTGLMGRMGLTGRMGRMESLRIHSLRPHELSLSEPPLRRGIPRGKREAMSAKPAAKG